MFGAQVSVIRTQILTSGIVCPCNTLRDSKGSLSALTVLLQTYAIRFSLLLCDKTGSVPDDEDELEAEEGAEADAETLVLEGSEIGSADDGCEMKELADEALVVTVVAEEGAEADDETLVAEGSETDPVNDGCEMKGLTDEALVVTVVAEEGAEADDETLVVEGSETGLVG